MMTLGGGSGGPAWLHNENGWGVPARVVFFQAGGYSPCMGVSVADKADTQQERQTCDMDRNVGL